MKEITVTRKLEFYPVGDNRLEFYKWFKNEAYIQTKAKQLAYNYMMGKEIVVDNMKQLDKIYKNELEEINQKIQDIEKELSNNGLSDKQKQVLTKKQRTQIDKRNKLNSNRKKEAYKMFQEAIGYAEQTELAKIVKSMDDYDGVKYVDKCLYKEHFSGGIGTGLSDFKNDYIELVQAKRAPRIYNTYDILDIRVGEKGREFNRDSISRNGSTYDFKLTNQFNLRFNLGSNPSRAGQAKQTLEDVMSGNYIKLCDSKIQKKDKKFFLLLVMKISVDQPILDKNRIMGIDLGMDIPAFTAMEYNPEWKRSFGNKKELLDFKTRIKALKDQEKHKKVYLKGGHGRKRKLQGSRTESLRNRESNFSKTYNHTLSKQIVDYAIKNKVGKIRMEKIDSKGLKDSKVLGDWTYYMLQNMIQTKAESKGIEVEYVNPSYTSKTCSNCGCVKEDFKLGNRDGKDGRQFHCPKCGLKLNCDHNAAINIAKGGILPLKKAQ